MFFDTFLHYLGDATIGTALVLIGVQLGDVKLSEGLGEITFVAIICVIFKPLFAIFIAHYIQFSMFYAATLMLVSAVPVGPTTYVLARHYRIYEKNTGASILMTSMMSIVTVPFMLWIMSHYWTGILH